MERAAAAKPHAPLHIGFLLPRCCRCADRANLAPTDEVARPATQIVPRGRGKRGRRRPTRPLTMLRRSSSSSFPVCRPRQSFARVVSPPASRFTLSISECLLWKRKPRWTRGFHHLRCIERNVATAGCPGGYRRACRWRCWCCSRSLHQPSCCPYQTHRRHRDRCAVGVLIGDGITRLRAVLAAVTRVARKPDRGKCEGTDASQRDERSLHDPSF